ncbi:TIGR02530 family flagellar biosynthesis protein [Acetivibrio clariflavus]|uniref:TIGR02530 family flagellar biosynthesis protein n=1 Tax=Acetivibrio clariflavus TaxID=288965 RepID=UPI00047FCDD0|nr:TIGR02530 family flagellar biosynthesis protein [Acetivibrio clariflavus]
MIVNNNIYNHINRISEKQLNNSGVNKTKESVHNSFDSILKEEIRKASDVKFSKHAQMRLESRNIKITDLQMQKISKALDKAEQKGVKDSLVMVDDIALVVNVKNRTVITAVNSNELRENVFTNIDGAVFA